MNKIYLASDHGGFELKQEFKNYLEKKGYEVIDLGPENGSQSVSYAEYGKKLGKEVVKNNSIGIGICGTGLGISYALNRIKKIRAARVTSVNDGVMAKAHNNANVLVFGGRIIKAKKAFKIFDAWEESSYEGGRHQKRIEELDK